jgi:hypothetical protein
MDKDPKTDIGMYMDTDMGKHLKVLSHEIFKFILGL